MVHPFSLLHDDFLVLRDLVDAVVDHLAFDEDLLDEILGTDFVQMKLVELLGCIDYFDLKLVGEVIHVAHGHTDTCLQTGNTFPSCNFCIAKFCTMDFVWLYHLDLFFFFDPGPAEAAF